MLNFENTFLEGLSVSAKVSGKASGRAKTTGKISGKTKTNKPGWGGPRRANAPKPTPKPRAAILTPTAKLSPAVIAKSPAVAVAIRAAQVTGKPVVTPTALVAAKAVTQANTQLAKNIMGKAVMSLATKAPILPPVSKTVAAAKAEKAVAPIADACRCQAKPVISSLNKHMTTCGFPDGTATTLLASLHDMNKALEKAAIQRLTTYEHNKLETKANFEHEVLHKLATIAAKLPACHPTRTKAHLTILKRS